MISETQRVNRLEGVGSRIEGRTDYYNPIHVKAWSLASPWLGYLEPWRRDIGDVVGIRSREEPRVILRDQVWGGGWRQWRRRGRAVHGNLVLLG